MNYAMLQYSVANAIARLTLNRPDRLNSFNGEMLAERLSAADAAAWGLIWRCVDDADFAAAVDRLAAELAVAPTRGLVRTREAILGSWRRTLAEQLDVERDFQRELGYTADYAEGVAAFAEKRAPRFTGR